MNAYQSLQNEWLHTPLHAIRRGVVPHTHSCLHKVHVVFCIFDGDNNDGGRDIGIRHWTGWCSIQDVFIGHAETPKLTLLMVSLSRNRSFLGTLWSKSSFSETFPYSLVWYPVVSRKSLCWRGRWGETIFQITKSWWNRLWWRTW